MPLRLNTTSRRLWNAVTPAAAMLSVGLACGCDTKGFVDPTELPRTGKDTLVLPIVSEVDPKLEEADTQWSRAQPPTADDVKRTTENYRISPNDLLGITLSDINGPNTETVKQSRVTESGDISLPYIDQPVHAAGMTEIQLEQVIIQAYREAKLIEKAQVSVTVLEARGRAFSIFGAVTAPGEYGIIDTDFRLMNALVLGRNVSTPFVDYIYVVRRVGEAPLASQPAISVQPTSAPSDQGPTTIPAPATGPSSEELAPKTEANPSPDSVAHAPPDAPAPAAPSEPVATVAKSPPQPVSPAPAGHPEKVILAAQASTFDGFKDPGPPPDVRVIRIPYQALKRGDLEYNIPVRPHDVIYVQEPQVGFYYVGGHVIRPGAYQLTGARVTLKDAIISASMLDGIAIPQRTDLIRRVGPAQEIFVRVDLEKIFAGEQPDIYLKPDDKVVVGTNALAPFLAAVRGAFRITYGFGFLYDRNYAYPINQGIGIP